MMLSNKHMEPVEEDNNTEVSQSSISSIGLESTLERQSIPINTLRLQCMIEPDISNTDTAPSKQKRNSGQVLEPSKDDGWSSLTDREICEQRDGGRDGDAVDGDPLLGAAKQDLRCVAVLSKGEEVS